MIDQNTVQIIEDDPKRTFDGKVIYPHLLTPGIHEISLNKLEETLLVPFEDKRTRTYLCNRFRVLFEELKSYKVEMIIWIDGSICSIKPHPSDIDMVIFLNENDLSDLPSNLYDKLLSLLENRDEIRARYGCDLYYEKMSDDKQRHYWRSIFSYNQLLEVKGFIQLRVSPHEHLYS